MQGRGHTGTISLMLLVGCLCLSTLGSAQDLQKAKADFLASNPNNGWTFGFLDKTGAFVAYNTTFKIDETTVGWCLDDMPGVFGDVTMCFSEKPLDKFGIQWETGQLCVNPGLDCQGVVIRWTAPGPATLNISGRLKGLARNGGKTGLRVSKDGATLASDVVAGDGFVDAPMEPPTKNSLSVASSVSSSADLNKSVSVSKGTVIDFIFAKDGERGGSHVGFDLNMQATGRDGGKVSYNPSPVGARADSRVASVKAVAK
jgi:hypothetical protein